jgi:hypothetical protein
MAEAKRKKPPLPGQVRLPADVDREIDVEAGRLGLFKYELVTKLWKAYKLAQGDAMALPDRLNIALSDIASVAESDAQSLSGIGQLTDEDKNWLRKFLDVLHSEKPGLSDALQHNLVQFEEFHRAWVEMPDLRDRLSGAEHGPAFGTARERGRVAELSRNADEVTKGLEDVAKRRKARSKRARRPPGKTG